MLRSLRPLALLLSLVSVPLAAQESVTALFDQDSFYERAGVLRGKGDIPFFADLNFLRANGDSTRAVLGIALSNSTFQFLKEADGYRATYEVRLSLEGGPAAFRNEWRETVRVPTFDETMIERETVVFQSSFGLLPGRYDLELEVRDAQSGETSKVESEIEVPRIDVPATGYALSDPVLLRFFTPGAAAGEREHVLYPSHYYVSTPDEVAFFVEVYAGEGAQGGDRVTVTLAPESGDGAVETATLPLPALSSGSARLYGTIPGRILEGGLYDLTTRLESSDGTALSESSVRLSVSAISQWVREHWDDAVELVAYEATDDEHDSLEDTPAERRLDAWNEFWDVRDPVPATPANEAFENYFGRIAAANASFGTKLRPGWKSDRGRVYVAFGAPSDVIRRPVQSGTLPIEIWVYDLPGFQIVFEDRIGFGNYQIANPGTFSNELSALERRKHRAIAERRAQLEGDPADPAGDGGDSDEEETAPPDSAAPTTASTRT